MHFFIDESGNFTSQFGISTVCSLALPSKEVGRTRREILFASRDWPHVNGELKSGSLTIEHLTKLVDIIFRRRGLLRSVSIDVGNEPQEAIERHRAGQCKAITKNLTDEHQPTLVEGVWELRRTLERMPLQLYVQNIAMTDLVCTAMEEATNYFAQRLPKELAQYEWIVDAKDPTRISTQEKWWRDTFGPLVETRSRDNPFSMVRDPEFDYRYFEKKFTFEKDLWTPGKGRERVDGIDLKAIFSEHVSFVDSRSDVLIQAIDVLAGFIRRVLGPDNNDFVLAKQLGRLQICQRRKGILQSIQLICLSDRAHRLKHVRKKTEVMAAAGRSMLRNPRKRRNLAQAREP